MRPPLSSIAGGARAHRFLQLVAVPMHLRVPVGGGAPWHRPHGAEACEANECEFHHPLCYALGLARVLRFVALLVGVHIPSYLYETVARYIRAVCLGSSAAASFVGFCALLGAVAQEEGMPGGARRR